MLNANYFEDICEISDELNEQKYGEMRSAAYELIASLGCIRLNKSSNIVFTTQPKAHCAAVANMFLERFARFASMRSECENVLYVLSFELNRFIVFWHIPRDIYNICVSKKHPTYLRPRAYMISIYREMYAPGQIEKLEENRALIKTLSKTSHDRSISSFSSQSSGFTTDGDTLLFQVLRKEIFVGIKAFYHLLGEPMEAFPYEVISNNVANTIFFIKRTYRRIKVKEESLPILNDIWFKRTTIIYNDRILCYIYNTAEYELIPFYQSDVRIGALYVVARFVLINIWITRLYSPALKRQIYYYYQIHDRLIEMIDKSGFDPLPKPLDKNYYGYNISERALLKQCPVDIEYKPYLFKKNTGHLLKFLPQRRPTKN